MGEEVAPSPVRRPSLPPSCQTNTVVVVSREDELHTKNAKLQTLLDSNKRLLEDKENTIGSLRTQVAILSEEKQAAIDARVVAADTLEIKMQKVAKFQPLLKMLDAQVQDALSNPPPSVPIVDATALEVPVEVTDASSSSSSEQLNQLKSQAELARRKLDAQRDSAQSEMEETRSLIVRAQARDQPDQSPAAQQLPALPETSPIYGSESPGVATLGSATYHEYDSMIASLSLQTELLLGESIADEVPDGRVNAHSQALNYSTEDAAAEEELEEPQAARHDVTVAESSWSSFREAGFTNISQGQELLEPELGGGRHPHSLAFGFSPVLSSSTRLDSDTHLPGAKVAGIDSPSSISSIPWVAEDGGYSVRECLLSGAEEAQQQGQEQGDVAGDCTLIAGVATTTASPSSMSVEPSHGSSSWDSPSRLGVDVTTHATENKATEQALSVVQGENETIQAEMAALQIKYRALKSMYKRQSAISAEVNRALLDAQGMAEVSDKISSSRSSSSNNVGRRISLPSAYGVQLVTPHT